MKLHSDLGLIADVVDVLKAHHEQLRILSEEESTRAVDWLRRFPEDAAGRIDWADLSVRICRPWEDYDERAAALEEVCRKDGVADATVIIVWGNALRPCVEMSLAVVRRHAPIILSADFDTWVTCPSEGWCIEVWHEGEVCFGTLSLDNSGNG